jgi:hypothetical protein
MSYLEIARGVLERQARKSQEDSPSTRPGLRINEFNERSASVASPESRPAPPLSNSLRGPFRSPWGTTYWISPGTPTIEAFGESPAF